MTSEQLLARARGARHVADRADRRRGPSAAAEPGTIRLMLSLPPEVAAGRGYLFGDFTLTPGAGLVRSAG